MKSKAQGTYPRRLVKQTHNRNPTFHSFHLFDLLHPSHNPETLESSQVAQVNKYRPASFFDKIIPNDLPKKQSVSNMPNMFQFEPLQNMPKDRPKVIEKKGVNQRSKSTGKLQMDSLSFAQLQFKNNKARGMDYICQLNFRNSRSIVQKQKVNYNIISNLPN